MKIELNPGASATITSIAIILLIGFAIYITESYWCLLGLLAVQSVETHTKKIINAGDNKL